MSKKRSRSKKKSILYYHIKAGNKEALRRLQWKDHPKLKGCAAFLESTERDAELHSAIGSNYNYYFHADSATDEHRLFEAMPKSFKDCPEWGWARHRLLSSHPSMKRRVPPRRSHSITKVRRTVPKCELMKLKAAKSRKKKKWTEAKTKATEAASSSAVADSKAADESLSGDATDCHCASGRGLDCERVQITEMLLIGGFLSEYKSLINVWRIAEDLSDCTPLESGGLAPCCRWSHSATYIEPINAIFVYGGFDSRRNWADPMLLFIDDMQWFHLKTPSASKPGIRALHTTVAQQSLGGS